VRVPAAGHGRFQLAWRLAALLVALAVAGTATGMALAARAWRGASPAADTVRIAVAPELLDFLEPVWLGLARAFPDLVFEAAAGPSDFDLWLVAGEWGDPDWQPAPAAPAAARLPVRLGFDHRVLAVGPLDPRTGLDRATAVALAAGPDGGAPVAATLDDAGLRVLRHQDLSAAWRPLAVDGVRPSLDSITGGGYPLVRAVWLVTVALPGVDGPLPGPAWWPEGLRRRLGELARPNATAVAAVRAWLAEAVTAHLHGDLEPEVELAACGDVMLARGVDAVIRRHGVAYPFARVAHVFHAADVSFCNLESPAGVTGAPIPGKGIWFRARPEALEALTLGGVGVVGVANNHILDYDTANFLETLELLAARGIAHVGGGRTINEARAPVVVERRGLRVAFLAYSAFADLFWSHAYPRSFAATADRPGVAPLRLDWVREDVARARELADVVVVAYHWGEEYQNRFTADQQALGRATIDAGADLVLGSHPHAVQGFELWPSAATGRLGLIAYSLGNFVTDQRDPVTRETFVLRVWLSAAGVRGFQVLPGTIEAGQPRLLEGAEAEKLLEKLATVSEPW